MSNVPASGRFLLIALDTATLTHGARERGDGQGFDYPRGPISNAPLPPWRPSATAAGSLPSSGVLRMTWTVLPITLAGRRSPFGPRGIFLTLVHCLAPS